MSAFNPRQLGARCDFCPRRERTPVPPEGDPKRCRFAIIGQDPGEREEELGRPFVGPTGTRLTHLLEPAFEKFGRHFVREHAFITNAALCRPVSQRLGEFKAAMTACRPRLVRELRQLPHGTFVLSLGKWALFAWSLSDKGLGNLQGFHVELATEPLAEAAKVAASKLKPIAVAKESEDDVPF